MLLLAVLVTGSAAWAQKLPERRHIRKGNAEYDSKRFAEAQDGYREALKLDSLSVEAAFNMGDAQYALEEFESAEQTFARLAENPRLTSEQRAKTYYNLGNAQFSQQKLQEALESYKESLRHNPNDMDTKFNYLYTKQQLSDQQQNQQQDQQNQDQQNQDQNQQGDGQGQDQNQEQNNNQNQDPNRDQNQDKPDQNNGKDNQEHQNQPDQPQGDKPKPSEGEQQPQPQQGPSKMSEQMLDAAQHAEDQTREKVEGQKVVGVGASGKNW